MKPLKCRNWSGRIQSLIPPAITIAMFAGACLLIQQSAWAAGVVTDCSEANLRAALAGGGAVSFACDGTITLAGTITNTDDVVLDGSGHQITISGNNSVRVFCNTTNARFTAINLAIVNGASAGGAGLLNIGGSVSLTGVSFCSNNAYVDLSYDPSAPEASGGAVLNRGGVVRANNCSFTSNRAVTPDGFRPLQPQPTQVCGGAIRNESGEMDLQSCTFAGNQAIGGAVIYTDAGTRVTGDWAFGGAIYNSGTMALDVCILTGNMAMGGSSPNSQTYYDFTGQAAQGGAIYNEGTMTIYRSSLSGNAATGGAGSNWGTGCRGGWAGGAAGGAICNCGPLCVVGCTLVNNVVTGGAGGNGQWPGFENPLPGGEGGYGGGGLGGAVYDAYGLATLVNCTVAFNTGRGGDGGNGGAGSINPPLGYISAGGDGGNGGGGVGGIYTVVYFGQLCSVTNCTIAYNSGAGGVGGQGGLGVTKGLPGEAGGARGTASVGSFFNTLFTSNNPAGIDTFADPKLGPLTDNGGPTLTMALLPGSPAIDAGGTFGAPATDQRGVPRPQGQGVDVGAFEYLVSPVFTCMTIHSTTNCQMQLSGLTPNPTLTLQISTNLLNWSDATNFLAGSNGVFQCVDPIPSDTRLRLYRLKSGTP